MEVIDKSRPLTLGYAVQNEAGLRIFVPWFLVPAFAARMGGSSWNHACLVALGSTLGAIGELEAERTSATTDEEREAVEAEHAALAKLIVAAQASSRGKKGAN